MSQGPQDSSVLGDKHMPVTSGAAMDTAAENRRRTPRVMRSETGDINTPPASSYAYLREVAVMGNGSGNHRSRPPDGASSSLDRSTSPPAVYSKDDKGFGQPTAEEASPSFHSRCAPAAVRRAIRTGSVDGGNTPGGNQDSMSRKIEELYNRSTAPFLAAEPIPLTSRDERRTQQRRARAARRNRQNGREEQRHGDSCHPCRLQGGCSTQVMPPLEAAKRTRDECCPYRAYPSYYCINHLRTGYCHNHAMGCCPWVHVDVSRASISSSAEGGVRNPSVLIPGLEFFSKATLQASAHRVGQLLLSFVDMTAAILEEFRDSGGWSPADLSSPQQLLEKLHLRRCTTAGEIQGSPDLSTQLPLYVTPIKCRRRSGLDEVLPTAYALSLPLNCAQCAIEVEEDISDVSSSSPAAAAAEEEEGGEITPLGSTWGPVVWSSFMNIRSLGIGADRGELHQPQVVLESGAVDSVQLTPAISDWVVSAALTRLHWESSATAERPGDAFQRPWDCFSGATMALLRYRERQLANFLSSETPSATTSPASAPTPWTAVCLLRDAALADRISSVVTPLGHCNVCDAVDDGETCEPFPSGTVSAGGSSETATPSARPLSLLTMYLMEEEVVVQHQQETRTIARSSAIIYRFRAMWSVFHRFLLRIHTGILQTGRDDLRGSSQVTTLQTSSTVALASAVQQDLLLLCTSCATALGQRYEADLLYTAGWQPLADVGLFGEDGRSDTSTAADYARHHQPCVSLACLNSVLNGLLLVTLRFTEQVFGLQERGCARQLLMSSPLQSGRGNEAASLARAAVRPYGSLSQQLPPYVALSLGFLSALEDHSAHQQQIREALLREFEHRRRCFVAQLREVRGDSKSSRSVRTGDHSSNSRTHSQHRHRRPSRNTALPLEADMEVAQHQVSSQHGTPMLDQLLPYGSACVSATAAALLLRLLLESDGSSYKALKLAASIVHASRMLRHASKQSLPHFERHQKLVHKRVWSNKSQKHVLVRKKVAVLLLVDSSEPNSTNSRGSRLSSSHREGSDALQPTSRGESRPVLSARRAVRPIGLAFSVDEMVVEEVSRLGLRMGDAGSRLVTGVVADCCRGALVDYTVDRCLPWPSDADVQYYCSFSPTPEIEQSDSVAQRPLRLPTSTTGVLSHAWEEPIITVVGLRGPGIASSSLNQWVPHRRVPPSPLLLEILEGHTSPLDHVRHTASMKLLLSDVSRFATWPVLMVLQYQASHDNSRYASTRYRGSIGAARAMHAIFCFVLSCTWQLPSTGSAGHGVTIADAIVALDVMRVQQQLHEEAKRKLVDVESWLTHPTEEGTLRAEDLSVKHVKDLLASEEPTENETVPIGGRSTSLRRPRLQLPALLYAVWTAVPRSTTQQLVSLWAICTATLLSRPSAELMTTGSCRDAHLGTLSLYYAYTTAGVLLRSVAPHLSHIHVEATVKALLLSPILNASRISEAPRYYSSKEAAPSFGDDAEWPAIFSSAYTPAVTSLKGFLHLQCDCCHSLLPTWADRGDCGDRSPFLDLAQQANTLVAALEPHCQSPSGPQEATPGGWPLMAELLEKKPIATAWIADTFIAPSPSLLLWISRHLLADDVEGFAALHTWISSQGARSDLPNELRIAILRQVQRRHDRAVHRRRRRPPATN